MKKILLWAFDLFSPKKLILLTRFYDRVEYVASKYGENFFSVAVEMSSNHGGDVKYAYTAYINSFDHSTGETIDEVIKNLVNQKAPVENKKQEVIV